MTQNHESRFGPLAGDPPVLEITDATLSFPGTTLWTGLNLSVAPHEFIAVIGANGSGKTSLMKAILGQEHLTSGSILLNGKPVTRGNNRVGYIPQQRSTDAGTPLRAKDMLRLGFDGHLFGLAWPSKKSKARVNHILNCVDAQDLADKPIGELSGGQVQRLRVGQAVIGEPDLILADEPLSALDLAQQKIVAELLDTERKEHNCAVLFVTHDVNPILGMVDRVLYLANGQFRIGTPDEVLRSDVLSELYGTPVDVVRNQGRIVVLGTQDHDHHPEEVWS
jgi:zinc/manganese transport system ATP-binding protein